MSDPAYCNVPAAEATAATIRDKTDATAAQIREKAESTLRAAQRLRDRLHDRWQQVSERVSETTAQIPAFKQELRDDATYIAERARYYHETRPVSALGFVAAAAFVLGVAVGLGRH